MINNTLYQNENEEKEKMPNNLLLNPKYMIDEIGESGAIYCKRLIEKWTPQLETEMLEAFIHLYYDEMYENWGPDDEEESKEYRTLLINLATDNSPAKKNSFFVGIAIQKNKIELKRRLLEMKTNQKHRFLLSLCTLSGALGHKVQHRDVASARRDVPQLRQALSPVFR